MQLIKVPGINSKKNTKGCRNAGNAIISGLEKIKTNEKGKPIDKNFIDLEEIHVNNEKLDQQESLIYENSLESFEKKDKLIFLGGDHSITFKTLHAFLDFCNRGEKTPCLIVFDAHPDVLPPEKNPTNEQWLSAIIKKGFPIENILLVGLRNSSSQELEFLKSRKIKQVNLNELSNNIEEVTDSIMEFSQGKELYISIDIDVIDPVFAPSTYSPETGGLTPRQILYIATRLNYLRNLRAIDITEVNSEEDMKKDKITIKLASKILAEFL